MDFGEAVSDRKVRQESPTRQKQQLWVAQNASAGPRRASSELRGRLWAAFGGLVVPVFLFHWYYDMELTLTVKSAVLVGSGLAMVAGRYFFCRGGAGEEVEA